VERSADRALYLPSGDWRVPQRVWRRGTGEIKVTLNKVDAVREGQGHAGSTPATSTNFFCGAEKIARRSLVRRRAFFAHSYGVRPAGLRPSSPARR
jgi:hypothetical protein